MREIVLVDGKEHERLLLRIRLWPPLERRVHFDGKRHGQPHLSDGPTGSPRLLTLLQARATFKRLSSQVVKLINCPTPAARRPRQAPRRGRCRTAADDTEEVSDCRKSRSPRSPRRRTRSSPAATSRSSSATARIGAASFRTSTSTSTRASSWPSSAHPASARP